MKSHINDINGKRMYWSNKLTLKELIKKKKANLSRANLSWANLSGANLSWANLSRANLSGANLSWANLSRANLSRANIDYSGLFLGCASFGPNTDKKQRRQVFFHWAMWVLHADKPELSEIEIIERNLAYLNAFHRIDVDRISQEMIDQAKERATH